MTAELKKFSNNATFVKAILSSIAPENIVGLFYTRIYPDGTITNLASDAHWSEFYFNQVCNGFYQNKDILEQIFIRAGTSLWELNASNKIWQDAKQYFGYGNGVTICEHHLDYREIFSIYSTPDNHQINHFYINQIDRIRKIKKSFLLHAFDLIQQSERERLALKHIIYPASEVVNQVGVSKNSILYENRVSPESSHDFKTSSLTKRVYVAHKQTGLTVQLTPQRSQCMLHLLQGKPTKKIAQAMQLAPKTVEHYLQMLRKELGCGSSKELITFYARQIVQ